MQHPLKLLRSERGVTLALMAVTVFLMLGMAAIAIDYGMIKSAKAEAQRAMDAAALAGASAFLINDPLQNKRRLRSSGPRSMPASTQSMRFWWTHWGPAGWPRCVSRLTWPTSG